MKIAIVDDEEFYIQDVENKIKKYQESHSDTILTVSKFKNGKEFLDSFMQDSYDLVYLDIQLVDNNGINIADVIHSTNPLCMIIFITSYMDYFNDSFIVHAFQYMKKPIKSDLFENELTRAIRDYQFNKKTFIFPTTVGNMVFEVDEIIYLETSYREYKVYTTGHSYYGSNKTITHLKEEILEYNFYKIQRSFIINLAHVRRYDRFSITMSNGDIIPISKKKYKEFKKRFLKFLAM